MDSMTDKACVTRRPVVHLPVEITEATENTEVLLEKGYGSRLLKSPLCHLHGLSGLCDFNESHFGQSICVTNKYIQATNKIVHPIDSGDMTMKVELSLDGKKIPMNKFVQKIIGSGIKGMVDTLDGVGPWKKLQITIEPEE
jgi:hypothetical protein